MKDFIGITFIILLVVSGPVCGLIAYCNHDGEVTERLCVSKSTTPDRCLH